MAQEALALPRRVLLVANPISGRGRGERLARELARGFERHGVSAELLLTRARGDAQRLVREAGPADLVVAVGGDGTLGEVLQGLPERTTPVGLLPCGTANVLAHALRMPEDPERALAGFLRGRIQALDVARVGESPRRNPVAQDSSSGSERYSHLVVGVGFDARVVQEVEARRRGPITKAVYVGAILRSFRRYRPVPLRVWIDGSELAQPVGMVWIANTPKYADVLRFARGTRLDDGQWEVYLFPTGRSSELLGAAFRGLLLHLPGGPITMRRARSVRVESVEDSEPVPYQVDGDLGGTTPLGFEVLPESFRLVVPGGP